jgi:hypothetical protein
MHKSMTVARAFALPRLDDQHGLACLRTHSIWAMQNAPIMASRSPFAMALSLLTTLTLLTTEVFSFPQFLQITTPSYGPTYDNSIPNDANLWKLTSLEHGEISQQLARISVNVTLEEAQLDISCLDQAEGAACMGHGSASGARRNLMSAYLPARPRVVRILLG